MTHSFNARISQEHSENVMHLALSLNVPSKNIVFQKDGCSFYSMKIFIHFDNDLSFNCFSEQIKKIPCILEKL